MSPADETERQEDSATPRQRFTPCAQVRVLHGRQAGTVRAIPEGGLVLGRASGDADEGADTLRLVDARVSRQHAELRWIAGAWHLVDLGSRNRGFVDGRGGAEGGRVELRDGSLIRVGNSLLGFRSAAAPDSTPNGVALGTFPGVSPAAVAVRHRLAQLIRGSGHVLVLGETGTGKERVARAFCEQSRPFVPQNCAELSRELARSELFGHVRGAFSGASAKCGLVEVADGGVLFLDELGELELDVQAELLRFLEDGCYRPIGATELRHSTARVVAATNVDLDEAVRAGRFRRDLLARLRASNAPLALPALRDRREDVLAWVNYFWREASEASPAAAAVHGAAPTEELCTAGAAECLLLYPWPENLRELRGVVRRLVAEHRAVPIQADDLPRAVREHRKALRDGAVASEPALAPPSVPTTATATVISAELTQPMIEAALHETQGSMRAAAAHLGIDRRKLYRLCERFGIDLDRHRANPEQEDGDGRENL